MFLMTEVSVVIPTFNRWPMLTEAATSVMAQRRVDFELIIVDDGSIDETAAELPGFVERLGAAHRPVRILRTENHGPAAARNRGVAAARAPFIAFLDSDDLWQPGKLERQLEHMRQRPECLVSQTGEVWMRRGVHVNPGLRHRKRGGDFFFDSLRTCLISPSTVMMRTSVFRELGGFDEDMRAGEDYDLWLRLLLEHQVELLPEPLVIRRAGHLGQLSATVPAIDRFRILALLKLLLRNDLSDQQREAVCNVLIEKCGIYGNGSARRGNTTEADYIASLAKLGDQAWRRMPDSSLEYAIVAIRANLARHHIATINSRTQDNELGRS
jgi:glycosyltransferase involved in cell wall biosynthesis